MLCLSSLSASLAARKELTATWQSQYVFDLVSIPNTLPDAIKPSRKQKQAHPKTTTHRPRNPHHRKCNNRKLAFPSSSFASSSHHHGRHISSPSPSHALPSQTPFSSSHFSPRPPPLALNPRFSSLISHTFLRAPSIKSPIISTADLVVR